MLFFLTSSTIHLFNSNFHREDWKGTVEYLENIKNSPLILFEDNNIPAPVLLYQKSNLFMSPGLKKVPSNKEDDINELSDSKEIYLLEYLVDINDPRRILQKRIKSMGFTEKEIINFRGVGFVYHYLRQYN